MVNVKTHCMCVTCETVSSCLSQRRYRFISSFTILNPVNGFIMTNDRCCCCHTSIAAPKGAIKCDTVVIWRTAFCLSSKHRSAQETLGSTAGQCIYIIYYNKMCLFADCNIKKYPTLYYVIVLHC